MKLKLKFLVEKHAIWYLLLCDGNEISAIMSRFCSRRKVFGFKKKQYLPSKISVGWLFQIIRSCSNMHCFRFSSHYFLVWSRFLSGKAYSAVKCSMEDNDTQKSLRMDDCIKTIEISEFFTIFWPYFYLSPAIIKENSTDGRRLLKWQRSMLRLCNKTI